MKPVVVFLYILVIACVCLAGCGEGSGPQETVKAFLDEVNKGNIQGGKLYFSGQYSGGYDPYDEKKLSTLFLRVPSKT